MARISNRHHYVPVFMAKNFTKENKRLIIYDKTKDAVFEAKPKNVFLESGRNTFYNEANERVDTIEKIYADLDSIFAKVLNDFKNNVEFNGKNLKMLLFLAYIMKWRVPQYDDSFKKAKDYFSVDDLGLGIKKDDKRLDIELESIFNIELQQELKRFLLAIQPFRFKEDYIKISQNSFLISTNFPALIGDCPLNEVQVTSDEVFEDFVFPITKDLTLIYSQRVNKFKLKEFLENGKTENVNRFLKDFSISRDLSSMAKSDRFVGGADKDYIENITNGYKTGLSNEKTKDYLGDSVFNILWNYESYNV